MSWTASPSSLWMVPKCDMYTHTDHQQFKCTWHSCTEGTTCSVIQIIIYSLKKYISGKLLSSWQYYLSLCSNIYMINFLFSWLVIKIAMCYIIHDYLILTNLLILNCISSWNGARYEEGCYWWLYHATCLISSDK